jgi:hypothetical protein
MSFNLEACTTGEKFIIPNIIGMTEKKAKLMLAGEVKTKVTYIQTNEYLPGIVLKLGDGLSEGDKMKINDTLDLHISIAPENSFSYSSRIEYVNEIGYVTGPDSPNSDILLGAGVGGTDLGIPFAVGDKTAMLFGDTFSSIGDHTGMWNSNFIALTSDENLNDGLQFEQLVTNSRGAILPFSQGLHHRNKIDEESLNMNREVTKIPTGAITIGEDVYIFFMSVRVWIPTGGWKVNYNQVIKTDHEFSYFEYVEELKWSEDLAGNFAQIMPFENPDDPSNIYFISIPGGRSQGASLFRVDKNEFENFEEYEYYLGNENWLKGSSGLSEFKESPFNIIEGPCSEMSIMFDTYLNQWIVVYLSGSNIIMKTSDSLTDTWSNGEVILRSSEYPGLYGGFVYPGFVDFEGRKFYLQISRWVPIYQTQLFEVVLK